MNENVHVFILKMTRLHLMQKRHFHILIISN